MLKRFYEVIDVKHRPILEDTIITALLNFADLENVKKHKIAALYYYHLLHSADVSDEFKVKLRLYEKGLQVLSFNPHFSSIFFVHQVEQDLNPYFDLQNLFIKSGFPLEQTIQPKQNFTQYLQVPRGNNSILHFNFTTLEYNIGFSVERVGHIKLGP